MFGSTILEVAIGLSLMFLLLSLVASAIREGIEGVIKARAVNLERGIRTLLDDPTGTGLSQIFYEHPLIGSLYAGSYIPMVDRFLGRTLPTYIPSGSFASVLIDLVRRGPSVGPYAALQTASTPSVAELRANAHRIPSAFVQQAFLSALDGADGDLTRLRQNLESWFDGTMNSVSGWYRRRTQLYLFVIGLALATLLNVNTFTVADVLWRDEKVRAALVDRAVSTVNDSARARDVAEARRFYAEGRSLGLPIGWDRRPPAPPAGAGWTVGFSYWTQQLFGIVLTAFAIMLGAPFWFDTLNKFVVVRSTVKPREKTGDEGSEDRSSSAVSSSKDRSSAGGSDTTGAVGGTTTAVAGALASGPASGSALSPASAPPSGSIALQSGEPPHEDREWSTTETENGIL